MSAGFDRVIDALDRLGSKHKADKPGHVLAQCPAHEDRNPSLSVTDRGDRALVHCFAGCDQYAVIQALNLNPRDLFDQPKVAYPYDNGREVVRSYGSDGRKKISQRNTDRPIELFGLALVRAAIADRKPVFVAEGEEDALSIRALGHMGTSAPQGAGNWHLCDYSPLIGARVYVVADNNTAGTTRARGLAAHLARIGAEVAGMITSPVGDDVTDGMAAGLLLEAMRRETVSDYLARTADTEEPEPSDAAEQVREEASDTTGARRLVLTAASTIKPRPVFWLWDGRLALGTLGLLAGREGIGKSTLAYSIAADVTRGRLPGARFDMPHAVLVAATEDSWEHTIVPRLIAADADLDSVYRVEVFTSDEVHAGLTLPRDLHDLEAAAKHTGAALLILDPLMSRLGDLDTHRDSEVRQGLEPLVSIADRSGMAILGLIHHNKSGATDPLQLVMGSKAFTAVARSVHTVVPDPDDDTGERKLFGTPKNNLGRSDLPTLSYTITSHQVDTDEGPAWTGRLTWGDERTESIGSVMTRANDDDKSATSAAGDWLADYLHMTGGAPLADIKAHGAKAGHTYDALKRARHRIGAQYESKGFPRTTVWFLPVGAQSEQVTRGDTLTALTALTGEQSVQSVQSEQSERDGDGLLPLDADTQTPPADHSCRVCSHELWSPQSRASGLCGKTDEAHSAARSAAA